MLPGRGGIAKRLARCALAAFGLLACAAQAQWGLAWRSIPSIVIVGAPDDPRQVLVLEAVAFWNAHLRELGSGFKLGPVTTESLPVPEQALQAMSQSVLAGTVRADGVPQALRELPGDLTIVLGRSAFVSFAGPFDANRKRVVGIREMGRPPLSLPNVARNVIAHELGHAIGLGHNTDASTLMCGRPAPCRPALFQSAQDRHFPLTDDERRALLLMYPAQWTSQPR